MFDHLRLLCHLIASISLSSRYHIHFYNVDDFMRCVLPYHETKMFVRVVQLLKLDSAGSAWNWLEPLQVTKEALYVLKFYQMVYLIIIWYCQLTSHHALNISNHESNRCETLCKPCVIKTGQVLQTIPFDQGDTLNRESLLQYHW